MSASPDQPAVAEIPRSAWLALAVATSTSFLVVLDITVVNVAFPSIEEDLGASERSLSWIVSGYAITVASLLLLTGTLADRSGRKRVFLYGLVVFLIGSAAAGLAPDVGWLIVARVVQAVGGSALFSSSLAMVLPDFPPERRSTAIGIWGAMGALGAAFGPPFGAFLISISSWRAIFLINVPLGIILLAFGPKYLSESRDSSSQERMDYFGVPIGIGGVALVMFGVVQAEVWGWTSLRVLALLIVGLALIPVLIYRSARHPAPMLDLGLFKIRSFSSTAAGYFLYALGFSAGFLLNAIMLQKLWDMSVLHAGLGLSPAPLLATVVSPWAGSLADRVGHRSIVSAGCALCGFGYLYILLLMGPSEAFWSAYLPGSLLVGVGVGLSVASFTSAGLSEVPPARFGQGNGSMRTFQQVGFAAGISAVVALRGTEVSVEAFRRGYIWVAVCYLAAAVVFYTFFPRGSSTQRQAEQSGSAAA